MRLIAMFGAALALALGGVAVAAPAGLPGSKTAADRAAWRAILHWPKACEVAWPSATAGAGIGVYSTAGVSRLVEVDCFLGAYQGTAMLYLVGADGHGSKALGLDTYIDPGSGRLKAVRERVILGVLGFTPHTGRLTVLDKFRGLGDCGVYTAATLRGDRFVTTSVRAKLACNGKPPYDATKWPKLRQPRVG